MAWEKRRHSGRRYYTRSYKLGGKVKRQYVGSGKLAELAAAHDAEARAQREAAAAEWRRERQEMRELDEQVATHWDRATLLAKAMLYPLGVYHDRGQWRRRRSNASGTPTSHHTG